MTKFTRKFFVIPAAVALLGGAYVFGSADMVRADDACSGLTSSNPNIVYQLGGSQTVTEVGDISFAGNSGNGFADVTTYSVVSCVAINTRSGKPVPGQNQTVQTDPVTVENVKVCQNVGQGGSEPIVGGASCG